MNQNSADSGIPNRFTQFGYCSSIRSTERNIHREIAFLQEFRIRLIADVVTGKLDVRAAAANLPETAAFEPMDEPAEGEDLDEVIGDDATEDAAA
jgi:type I restriction enzyme S subunit